MSFEVIRVSLEEFFLANFDPTIPVKFENVEFDPPKGQKKYVAFFVRHGESFQVGMSPPTDRYIGAIIIQIFLPLNDGSKKAADIADDISEFFKRAYISGLTTRVPNFAIVGEVDGKFQCNLTIPFIKDIISG